MRKGNLNCWLRLLVLLFSIQVWKIRGSDIDSSEGDTRTTFSNEGLDVVILTSENFERNVGDGSVWLVEFYAPWCTHCMSFAPTYSDIARHFHSNPDLKVKVGKVDTTEQRALGQRFSVNAYPSFFVVKGSSVYEFEGTRSKTNLIQFVMKDYKEQGAIPFYSSPMGPLGRLQGLLIWAGVFLMNLFSWVQTTSGFSPLVTACLLVASVVFASTVGMIALVLALTPREKID